MSKFEWRKQLKELYLPKNQPTIIEVPEMKYFTIEGSGNPNSEQFKKYVETLYTLSYAIRMMPKKGIKPNGYFEYTVFPLEGHWDLDEEGRKLDYLNKEFFVYKLMIRQPNFVNEALFNSAKEIIMQKKTGFNLENVNFETIDEGLCVQVMHLGSYDDEPETFAKMEQFCDKYGYKRLEKTHIEIYVTDPRKTTPEKLKTVLRFKVVKL